jgi:hypothetical protein
MFCHCIGSRIYLYASQRTNVAVHTISSQPRLNLHVLLASEVFLSHLLHNGECRIYQKDMTISEDVALFLYFQAPFAFCTPCFIHTVATREIVAFALHLHAIEISYRRSWTPYFNAKKNSKRS